jgi:ABC-2 type transport system ATP-binding protein
MRQRLAIARGLLTDPQVLFMDEPTRSLDPPAAQTLRKFIKEKLVEEQGKTIFLASHIMEEVEYLCDRIAILNYAKILACGTLLEIRQTINRRQVYSLGLQAMPEGLLARLGQVEGVVNIQPIPSASQPMSYFRVEIQYNNGHAIMPDVIDAIVRAGGRVSACAPIEEPLSEVLARVLKGEARQ